MSTQRKFNFSKEQSDKLRASIVAYFLDELDIEIGTLQANLFIDFLNEKIGNTYYNLGVSDAMKAIKEKTDDLVLLIRD